MMELLNELANIAGNGRILNAIIFDDEIDDDPTPPLDHWMTLRDQLADLEMPVLSFLEDNGHNVHHAPSLSLLRQATEQIHPREDSEAAGALRLYLEFRSVLQKLKEYLESLGFHVTCSTGVPKIDPGSPPLLCLVDYQILPEGDDGDTAIAFFRELMESSQQMDFPPPYVFLMSKALTDNDAQRWAKIAELAGLFRFNYGFLNKDKFNQDPLNLGLPLLHHLKHDSLSRAYFEQVRAISIEAQEIAKSAVQRIFQVTPPEFNCFKSRVADEGGSLAEELLKVFSNLLLTGLKKSPAIGERMGALEEVFTNERMPVPYRQNRSALHQIYSEFLFQKCYEANNEPRFGDVYEIDVDRYALIISQECDLKSGTRRNKKVDRVLAIEGVLRRHEPNEKTDGSMLIGKPIYFPADDQRMWIWWNVANPLVIPLSRFTASGRVRKFQQVKKLEKKWILREADAEQIQHLFSAAVTRVGTEIAPDYVSSLDFRCYSDDLQIENSPAIHIYKTIADKKNVLAVAPESQVALLSVDSGTFLTCDRITGLSEYVPYDAFIAELGRDNVMPLELEGELRLTKVSQAYKRGKKPWKI